MPTLYYDIQPGTTGGYETDEGLATAVLLSLLTDARADAEDDVQDPTDPRGWWGDDFSEEPGDVYGSKLWIAEGQLLRQETLDVMEDYIRQALQWMLDDGLVDLITVELEIANERAEGRIILDRPRQQGQVAVDLWNATLA